MNMRVNSLIKSQTLNSHITKMGLILSFNTHLLSFFFLCAICLHRSHGCHLRNAGAAPST